VRNYLGQCRAVIDFLAGRLTIGLHERAWTRIEAALNLAQAEYEQHVLFVGGILNSFKFINVSNHNDACAPDAYIFSVVGTATVNCSARCLLIKIRSCTKVQ